MTMSDNNEGVKGYQARYQKAKADAIRELLSDPGVKATFDVLFADAKRRNGIAGLEQKRLEKKRRELLALAEELGADVTLGG